ncbi:hypothetical protein FA13DRAFT_1742539 [Coprinellus micaceus]|uniref:NACHT domain-containing protein n=1 Tax=Coprinellus micaceus TaxID=71717 RepID=A0A4Y7SG97_COPMI|nr:hypothetical protein FA13DRAFT_1742539 [Coprinellus micaceus]
MQRFTWKPGKAPAGSQTFTAYDISTHDSSSHHHGDNHQYNTHHHYALSSSPPMSSRLPQDRLEGFVSKGAAHNSLERGIDAPKCHPKNKGGEKVLWLTGPAGAGKTAIMGSLAGSFFISESAMKVDRCSKRYLIPTLAFHLLELIPGLRALILTSIKNNPSVFDKQLEHQVEILILGPIRELCKTADASEWPKAVLVDGVDECASDEGQEYRTERDRWKSKEGNQREVLAALIRAAADPSFPFRLIIASRPEQHIEKYFSSLPAGVIKKIFLDAKFSPEADVELYGKSMLNTIGMDCGLQGKWYCPVGEALGIENVPRHLAQQSSGQFVYIATVIRYIQDTSGGAHKRLEDILNWRPRNPSNPFEALDVLYSGILQTSPNPVLAAKWIRAINSGVGKTYWRSMCLLESFPGETKHLFNPLMSLVRIVDEKGEPDFHLYHKSLSDSLKDPKRCGAFYITKDDLHGFLAHRHIQVLKNKGPQGQLPPEAILGVILRGICSDLPDYIGHPHTKEYDASHVGWWFSHLPVPTRQPIHTAFQNAHRNCNSFSHTPTCELWTGYLKRYARDMGRDLPRRERFSSFRLGWQ